MIPDRRDVAIAIAWRLYGTPYVYGGNDPYLDGGLDCSGLIRYILRRVGVIPLTGDWSAQGFYDMFEDRLTDNDWNNPLEFTPHAGYLAFYGTLEKISHVMLCLNEGECIGCINGDKCCSNEHTARCRQAMVDIRPINYRDDLVAIIDPFKKGVV